MKFLSRISWDRWAQFTLRRPKALLIAIALVTAFFAVGMLRLNLDTQIHDFHTQDLRALIEDVEGKFDEGNYLALIFESPSGRSLLEPELLQQQWTLLKAIRDRYGVKTLSLVDAIEEGLRRVKKKSLMEVDNYDPIGEGLLGLSSTKTRRDLEKMTRYLLSDPERIAYYSQLRFLGSMVGATAGPLAGGGETTFKVPPMKSIKAFVQLDPQWNKVENKRALVGIRDLAKSLAGPNLQVHLLADDLITAEIDERTVQNLALMTIIVMLAVGGVFWLMFRRKVEVLLPFLLMGTSLIWTFGAAGWLGLRLSFLHLLVMPILFGTADDDAFVFATTLDEDRQTSPDLAAAVRKTLCRTGTAIFLTTFTTFIAFFFGAFPITSPGIFNFNIVVAFSMIAAFILTVCLQGPLRLLLHEKLHPQVHDMGPVARIFSRGFEATAQGIGALSQWVLKCDPLKVSLVFLAAMVVGILLALKLPTEFSRRIFLRPGMQTQAAEHANQKYFGRSDHGYILFEGAVDRLAVLQALKTVLGKLDAHPLLEKIYGKANTDSLAELMGKFGPEPASDQAVRETLEKIFTEERTANFVRNQKFSEAVKHLVHRGSQGFDATVIKFFVTGGDGKKIREWIAALQSDLRELNRWENLGLKIRIGGGDMSYYIGEGFYFRNFIQSFGLSLIFNFMALYLMWRRVKDSLLTLVPVFFSLALTLGVMGLFQVPLNALNICIGSIVVGVGVDYSIHILERFEEERRKYLEPRRAMEEVLKSLGPSIVAGALTTVVGFASCAVLAMPLAASFGMLLALAIFFAFVSSLVGLPSLILIFFKKN